MRILQARILEWVVCPFSRGSSQPRSWTRLSRITGRFFACWASREAPTAWMPFPYCQGLSDHRPKRWGEGVKQSGARSGSCIKPRQVDRRKACLWSNPQCAGWGGRAGGPACPHVSWLLRIHVPRMRAVLSGVLHVPSMALFLSVFKYSFMSYWQCSLVHPRDLVPSAESYFVCSHHSTQVCSCPLFSCLLLKNGFLIIWVIVLKSTEEQLVSFMLIFNHFFPSFLSLNLPQKTYQNVVITQNNCKKKIVEV